MTNGDSSELPGTYDELNAYLASVLTPLLHKASTKSSVKPKAVALALKFGSLSVSDVAFREIASRMYAKSVKLNQGLCG